MTPEGARWGFDRASRGGVSIVRDNERGGGEVLRGRLAGGVRLIFVALLATVGARIGERTGTTSTSQALLFVFVGAGAGYVIGGVFGRLTLRAVHGLETELGKKPPAVLAGGVVGLVVGLVIAGLTMIPLLFLPASASW